MDLRASTLAMAMCAHNGRVVKFNNKRRRKGLEPICTPEQGLNISELFDDVVENAMAKCSNNTATLDRYETILCKRGRTAMDYCRSPDHLLSSTHYKLGMRSMLRHLMGRFTAQEQIGLYDYYAIEEHLEKEIGLGFPLDKVEEYTLVDLGGLDSNIMHTAYNGYRTRQTHSSGVDGTASIAEPDFLWFGITERMEESTCLLYYTLRVVKPLAKTPQARVMKCPTTSFWTNEHREIVKQKEPADYAVWRTANAIMDLRMEKMKMEIQSLLDSGETKESLYYVDWDQLEKVGVTF